MPFQRGFSLQVQGPPTEKVLFFLLKRKEITALNEDKNTIELTTYFIMSFHNSNIALL